MQKTDNEVIAEFIGLKPENYYSEDDYTDYGIVVDGIELWRKEFDLPYPNSFSALMPVWYKFRDLQFGSFGYHNAWIEHKDYISYAILNKGCAEACRLLAEGIRWYNSIQK